jgi:hypothetical protein
VIRTFTCEGCGSAFTTDQTHVRTWPIDKWWLMVGHQCANCRVERQGEPRQGNSHVNGRDTEVIAARAIAPLTGRHRARVIHLLRAYPEGLTDDEGGARMGGDRLTFGRRRSELTKAGLVKDSGQRRPTKYGRPAIVWVLATDGAEA